MYQTLLVYPVSDFLLKYIKVFGQTIYRLYTKFLNQFLLLYNVVLVSAIQQSESVTHIHISPLFKISFPFRSPQSTEQNS